MNKYIKTSAIILGLLSLLSLSSTFALIAMPVNTFLYVNQSSADSQMKVTMNIVPPSGFAIRPGTLPLNTALTVTQQGSYYAGAFDVYTLGVMQGGILEVGFTVSMGNNNTFTSASCGGGQDDACAIQISPTTGLSVRGSGQVLIMGPTACDVCNLTVQNPSGSFPTLSLSCEDTYGKTGKVKN